MTNLEKRLANLEQAFYHYVGMTYDLLPLEYQDEINRLMNDYLEANDSLINLQPDKE